MQFSTSCVSASCACYKAEGHEHETGNIRPATSHKVAVQEVTVQQVIEKVAAAKNPSHSHYPICK